MSFLLKFEIWIIGLLLLGLYAIRLDFLLDSVLLPKFFGLSLIVCIMSLNFVAFQSNNLISFMRAHLLFIYTSIAYIIFIFLSFLASPVKFDAFLPLGKEVLIFLFFIAFVDILLKNENNRSAITLILFLIPIVPLTESFVEMAPIIISGNWNVEQSYGVTASMAHRNLLAYFLGLTLGFSLYQFLTKKYSLRWLYLLVFIVQVIVLILLMCRGAIVSAVAACFLTFAFYLFNLGESGRVKLILTLLIPLILTLILVFVPIDESNEVEKIIQSLRKWDYGSVAKRLQLWSSTLSLIQERPFLGSGLTTWRIEILQMLTNSDITQGNQIFYQRPHNDFLWIWAESGLLALFARLFMFTYLFYFLLFRMKSSELKFLRLLGIYTITFYLFMALFSFPKERIEFDLILAVMSAIILTSRTTSFNPSFIVSSRTGLLVAAIAVTLGSFSLKRMKGEYNTKRAFSYMANNNWEGARTHFERAESNYFKMDLTSTPISWYLGMIDFKNAEFEKASVAFQRAYQLNPYHVHVLNNLATTKYKLGLLEESLDDYQKLLDLAPGYDKAIFNLTVIYYHLDSIDYSVKYAQKIDTNELNHYQRTALNQILAEKMELLIAFVNDTSRRKVYRDIQRSEVWMRSILRKSALEERTFDEQIELDVEYIVNMNLNSNEAPL